MDTAHRAKKDMDLLKERISKFKSLNLHKKYTRIFDLASRYLYDAKYYFDKGDYVTSFACSNYAYGLLDAVFLVEDRQNKIASE